MNKVKLQDKHLTQILWSSLYPKKTNIHEIAKIIRSLKRKDSHGYNEISTRILKISAPYVLSLLKYIFNKILSMGVFLTD